ncbi:calcyclin binding protein [Marchantia polymorpha subsp. ruderalis]|uniref:Calcyclin-binding protein n=2 Tax=Marchantia polymorpha TaxID=3197 RepID=A0AAF6BAQ5_MARPO|nr:hypothetical protein MARPO_0148s0015 [Marchantia polymorpha]BBN09089.1 hypothetical protein Mp_4g17050 [Marchantia polymorpha subsp. ruderalis]|eukprot:PTQ29065.1 hypothetical protein MARPO_0148s0015 [Marchantia polymorpha]
MAEASNEIADLEELEELLSAAKRPRVQGLLRQEIEALKKSQATATEKNAAVLDLNSPPETKVNEVVERPLLAEPMAPVQSVPKFTTPQTINYISLDRFSYDQELDKVKIYIFLEGASQDKVVADFKTNSFDLKIHDVGGKNYRCGIPRLNGAIIPESCGITVKPKRIIITLRKAEKQNWTDIHYKEDKFKPSKNSDKDPMAGIMDLMKNMYDEGDEETKRTIAKAWSESRSGKTSDPLSKYGGL